MVSSELFVKNDIAVEKCFFNKLRMFVDNEFERISCVQVINMNDKLSMTNYQAKCRNLFVEKCKQAVWGVHI